MKSIADEKSEGSPNIVTFIIIHLGLDFVSGEVKD